MTPAGDRTAPGAGRDILRRTGRALLRYVDDGHGWIGAFGPLGVPPGLAVRLMRRPVSDPSHPDRRVDP